MNCANNNKTIFYFQLRRLSYFDRILHKCKPIWFVNLRLETASECMRKERQTMKESIKRICTEEESDTSILRPYNWQATGRPNSSKDQPALLSAIVNIVQASTAADDRRRTETLCTVKTPDDLHAELKKIGFNLSRSTWYLSL